MAPKRNKNNKKEESFDSGDDSEDYRKKRDRNNLAVKRSRIKSKLKTQETMSKVNQLRNENSILEEKVKNLTKELGFLKELFLAHASNSNDKVKFENIDLEKLLTESTSNSSESTSKK